MNNYQSTAFGTDRQRGARARRGAGGGNGERLGCCCLMVADNGWIWGARGERSEPSMGLPPASCCYLMVAVMVLLEVKENRTLCYVTYY